MRGDEEDAAEDIQLLKPKLNLGRAHRRWKAARRRFHSVENRRAHDQNAQRATHNLRPPITHER
jgi:hypothetical protein